MKNCKKSIFALTVVVFLLLGLFSGIVTAEGKIIKIAFVMGGISHDVNVLWYQGALDGLKEIGADYIIISDIENTAEKIRGMTYGRGADVVVEASGAPKAIASTVSLVRRLGHITVIGMTGRDQISFPWDAAIWKACTIAFNLSTGYTSWEKAIGLIASKKIDVTRLISHRLPLDQWQDAVTAIESGEALKALLIP